MSTLLGCLDSLESVIDVSMQDIIKNKTWSVLRSIRTLYIRILNNNYMIANCLSNNIKSKVYISAV